MSNLQNMYIKERLAMVNLAVNTLHALGLTVQSINVDDRSPLIRIDRGAGCSQLKSGYTKHHVRAGHRLIERVAMVSDCQVRWEEAQ